MTATYTIKFSVNETILDSEEKTEAIVESIIDEFIPAVAMTTGACPDEIAVRLMIELSFQIGATHSPASILGLLAAYFIFFSSDEGSRTPIQASREKRILYYL